MKRWILAVAAPLWVLAAVWSPAVAGSTDVSDQQSEPKAGYDADGLLHVSPDFFELSTATGGDFYFWAPDEFAFSSLRIPTENEDILLAYGELDRSIRTFDFAVDSTVTRFAVVAGAQEKLTFSLIRPDGVVVDDAHEGVDLQHFQHMLIVSVDHPQPGRWSFEAQGAGRFSLSVRAHVAGQGADEGLMLIDFAFVELRGRAGHEGFFESAAPLVSGTRRLCRASLSGQWETAEVVLVSADGSTLTTVEPDTAGAHPLDELVGTCSIPSRPFRIVVTGIDLHGAPFMRTHPPVLEPR